MTSTQSNEPEGRTNRRRALQGVVVSDRMAKTIGVRVERITRHPKYRKYIRRHKKYLVHDENGEARVGDTVEIRETRPLSKLKRWRLVRVVSRASLPEEVGS